MGLGALCPAARCSPELLEVSRVGSRATRGNQRYSGYSGVLRGTQGSLVRVLKGCSQELLEVSRVEQELACGPDALVQMYEQVGGTALGVPVEYPLEHPLEYPLEYPCEYFVEYALNTLYIPREYHVSTHETPASSPGTL